MSTSTTFDDLLRHLDPAKAERVRSLFAGRKLDPQDPLWEVMVSLDIAAVLLEDGPMALQATLQQHHSQLQAWSTQNLNILHALSAKAEALEKLSQLAPELTATSQRLAEESPQVLSGLQEVLEQMCEVQSRSQHQQERREQVLKAYTQLGPRLHRTTRRLEQTLHRPSFLYRSPSSLLLLTALFSLVSSVASTLLLLHIL